MGLILKRLKILYFPGAKWDSLCPHADNKSEPAEKRAVNVHTRHLACKTKGLNSMSFMRWRSLKNITSSFNFFEKFRQSE